MNFYNRRSTWYSMLNVHLTLLCVLVLCGFHISGGENSATRISDPRSGVGDDNFAFPGEIRTEIFPQRNFHNHHHHHDPYFHHHHTYDVENPVIKGYPKVEDPKNIDTNISVQIPLEFIQNINELDVDTVLSKYVEGANIEPFLKERFGGESGTERKAAITPAKAGCIPELKSVKVTESIDPTIVYIPQCTRVPKCGGCCTHSLLSCQAQEVEIVNFEVFKTQFTGGKKLKFLGKEIVSVEQHTKCKCDCRLKAEDCSIYQEYKPSECKCVCANYDEEQKCHKNSAKKLWNPDLCLCQCRQTLQCSTGSFFDQNDCKCKMTPLNRRVVNIEKRSNRANIAKLLNDD